MDTLTLDGRVVACDERGSGSAPPLLCVHGFTGAKEDFEPVIDALGADRRVVAVDLPGHGGSEGPDDPDFYGLWPLAYWVERVADLLGLGEHHLLGHSMGGLIVQRIAARSSHRLASLTLMGTGLGALPDEAGEHVLRVAKIARDQGMAAAFEESIRAAQDADVDDGARQARKAREDYLRARYLRLNPAAVVGGARNLTTAIPVGAFLRGIDIPTLVIHGAGDYAWGESEQRLLAATVNGAQRVVVPDSYHSPQVENPEVWLAAVRGFLRRADDRADGGADDRADDRAGDRAEIGSMRRARLG